METAKKIEKKPGVCIPWEERAKEFKNLSGDVELSRRVWEQIDELGYLFIWFYLTW